MAALGNLPFLVWVATAVLLVPALTRGSYRRLAAHWEWGGLLVAGFALQQLTVLLDPPAGGTHRLGFGLLVAGSVLVLGFTLRNAARTGMVVVSIGIALNFVAIVVNEGMPVRVPASWEATGGATTTVRHHPETDADSLTFLGDIVLLPNHDELISFGDLIMAAGLLSTAFHASRPRRRATRAARPARVRRERARRAAVATTSAPEAAPPVAPVATLDLPAAEAAEAAEPITTPTAQIVEFVELDLTDAPPKPPSPIVAGVIAELDEMRRAARDRHPSALFERRRGPLVGRYSPHQHELDAADDLADDLDDDFEDFDGDVDGDHVAPQLDGRAAAPSPSDDGLERLQHAPVVHITGAGIEGLQRQPRP